MGSTLTKLATAPAFNPHRIDIDAADTLPVTNEMMGVNADSYAEIMANLTCTAGGGSASFEVLFWSPQAGAYVHEPTPTVYVVPTGTTQAVRFVVNGRRFFIAVTAVTVGRKASAEIAAFWVDPRFD